MLLPANNLQCLSGQTKTGNGKKCVKQKKKNLEKTANKNSKAGKSENTQANTKKVAKNKRNIGPKEKKSRNKC